MDVVGGTRRLLPGGGPPANANAFLGAIAAGSLLGWAATAAITVATVPPGSGPISPKAGAWLTTAVWLALTVVGLLVGYTRVEEGATSNLPMFAWVAVVAVGFPVSAFGTATGKADVALGLTGVDVMWGAWYPVYGLAYLVTGALVTRGGVYLVGGALSILAFFLGFYVVGFSGLVHAVVLTALGVVPVAVDAYRGGRQVDDDGVPAVQRQRLGSDEGGGAGGVIDAD